MRPAMKTALKNAPGRAAWRPLTTAQTGLKPGRGGTARTGTNAVKLTAASFQLGPDTPAEVRELRPAKLHTGSDACWHRHYAAGAGVAAQLQRSPGESLAPGVPGGHRPADLCTAVRAQLPGPPGPGRGRRPAHH